MFLMSNSPNKQIFSLWPDQPIDSPDRAPISEIQVVDWFHTEQSQHFFIHNFFCPFLPRSQIIIFSELHTFPDKLVQLSSQGRHGRFYFRTESANFRDLDPSFVSTRVFQHLKMTQYLAPVSRNFSTNLCIARVLSHLMVLAAAGCHLLPLAAENQTHRRG